MTRAIRSVSLCLAVLLASCAGAAKPPPELSGLWSQGPASCAAGIGVRFESGAIAAVYERQHETLFDAPQYQVEARGDAFRVRIRYRLPERAGGARSGAYGVVVLVRGEDGGLKPEMHNLVDERTGSALLRIEDDPAFRALTLHPCDRGQWLPGLRGRDA